MHPLIAFGVTDICNDDTLRELPLIFAFPDHAHTRRFRYQRFCIVAVEFGETCKRVSLEGHREVAHIVHKINHAIELDGHRFFGRTARSCTGCHRHGA